MPAISRDEVAHLARLARLAVTDRELDTFAGQLEVILGAVARVGEVAADDIPPTSHAVPLTNVFRPDEIRPGLTQEQALAGAPVADGVKAVEGGRFRVPRILDRGFPGAGVPRMRRRDERADHALGRRAGRVDPRREVSATEVTQAHLDRIAAVDAEIHAFLHVAAEGALAAARGRRRVAAGRGAARLAAGRGAAGAQGRVHHQRHADHLRLEDPRGLAAAVRRDGHHGGCARPGS